MKTARIIAAATAVLAITGHAYAITIGSGPAAPAVAAAVPTSGDPATAAQQADDSNSIREGAITEVGAKSDRILVNGSWLKVIAGKTRLFRRGIEVSRDVLETGQKLRFTLAPGEVDRSTLGVVYVP